MSTRRYTYYGQCLILFLALNCLGQEGTWSTNAWPAYQYPREGRRRTLDCYNALLERANALGRTTNNPYLTYPRWYRKQKTMLENYKNWIRTYGGVGQMPATTFWFISPNCVTNGSLIGWLNAGSNSFTQPIIFKNEVFPELLKTPTNILSYTPFRGLDGIGPFTNDVSVGHPHGWTNASTMAGGDNFPAGRTRWYTTDYDFDMLRTIITNMRYVVEDGYTRSTGKQWFGGAYSQPDEDTAKSTAIAAYVEAIAYGVDSVYSKLDNRYGYWTAVLNNGGYKYAYKWPSFMTTNVPSRLEAYTLTAMPTNTGEDHWEFYDHTGLYSARGAFCTNAPAIVYGGAAHYMAYGWNIISNTYWSNVTIRCEYGSITRPDFGTGVAGESYYRGFYFDAVYWLADFQSGFKYK